MKYACPIWAVIWRRPDRTVLMSVQLGPNFTLFGVPERTGSGMRAIEDRTRESPLLAGRCVRWPAAPGPCPSHVGRSSPIAEDLA
jgi:hypothetical protein